MRNKYVNRAKISEKKFRELVRYFSLDLTAIQIADLTGLNRNTVNRYLTEIRRKIARHCELTSPVATLNIPQSEVSEHSSFSILIREYDSRMYTETAPPKAWFEERAGIPYRQPVMSNYDILIDLKSGKHHILRQESADSNLHRSRINRIESFWGQARTRLAKFKGLHASTFRYHMKECEFRFNHRREDLYLLLLKLLRKDPLF